MLKFRLWVSIALDSGPDGESKGDSGSGVKGEGLGFLRSKHSSLFRDRRHEVAASCGMRQQVTSPRERTGYEPKRDNRSRAQHNRLGGTRLPPATLGLRVEGDERERHKRDTRLRTLEELGVRIVEVKAPVAPLREGGTRLLRAA